MCRKLMAQMRCDLAPASDCETGMMRAIQDGTPAGIGSTRPSKRPAQGGNCLREAGGFRPIHGPQPLLCSGPTFGPKSFPTTLSNGVQFRTHLAEMQKPPRGRFSHFWWAGAIQQTAQRIDYKRGCASCVSMLPPKLPPKACDARPFRDCKNPIEPRMPNRSAWLEWCCASAMDSLRCIRLRGNEGGSSCSV